MCRQYMSQFYLRETMPKKLCLNFMSTKLIRLVFLKNIINEEQSFRFDVVFPLISIPLTHRYQNVCRPIKPFT